MVEREIPVWAAIFFMVSNLSKGSLLMETSSTRVNVTLIGSNSAGHPA
jgi:hypothetical protein